MNRGIVRRPVAGGLVAMAALGCAPTTGDDNPGLTAARAGAAATGDPTVESVIPASATQDTTLDVRVLGSNYDRGSTVAMLLDGQVTTKVRTNSTRYKNGGELVANITIAADALVAAYDVLVTTSRGKKGIGIEKFAVQTKGNPQTVYSRVTLPATASPAGLYGDLLGEYDAYGDFYINLDCDVGRSATIRLAGTGWALTGVPATCSPGNSMGVRLSIENILNTDCPDGQQCPIGTTGHNGTQNYSANVYFYFKTDKDGDGRFGERGEDAYNVVWVNTTAEVLQRSGATPCTWHVRASSAQLWKRDATQIMPATAAVSLDVVGRRTDLCP